MQGSSVTDPFFLQRFLIAQEGIYPSVLTELKSGHKRTHWMWFIFPQVDGLGLSETTRYYAIKSLAEARAYLDHPLLGTRLVECTALLLALKGLSAHQIFNTPDDRKLQSCMTLFSNAANDPQLFNSVLTKYYEGSRDPRTDEILEVWRSTPSIPSEPNSR